LGTDISPEAVARASRAIYSDLEVGRGLNPALLSRHFTKREDGWQIRDEIRAMASFRTTNLLRDIGYLGQFDIVFCRNVAIYFSESDKTDLFRRMRKIMAPDGYLIVGSTESIAALPCGFEPKKYLRSVFYQPTSS